MQEKRRGETKTIEDHIEHNELDEIIAKRKYEINLGIPELFPCETFDAIEEIRPNMLLMNYEQIDEFQAVMAEKYCPDLLHKLPLEHQNVLAGDKDEVMYVKLSNDVGDGNGNKIVLPTDLGLDCSCCKSFLIIPIMHLYY